MGKTELEYPYYHQYYYEGDRMIAEVWESEGLFFLYDSTGIIGMQYWYDEELMGTYWFSKNLQGDIVAMYGDDGTLYETYTYDAWGNKTTTRHSSSYSISCPFGYRSYYYDSDLGLYYLQSRYYDPATGRFISPDRYVSTDQGILGNNMFAYCGNNPVNRVDPSGEFWLGFLIVSSIVVATAVVVSISANVGTVIASNLEVNSNGDIEPMNDEEYKAIVGDETTKGSKDTSNLSSEKQIAYIRRVREENEEIAENWSEAQMLRELVYHDRGYRLLQAFGQGESDLGKRLKFVDFEVKQDIGTFIRRFIGNIMFW